MEKDVKRLVNWQVLFGFSLVTLSTLVYIFHYFLFQDAHHIFIYLIGDIAFVFFDVLLVTLILDRVLNYSEKRSILKKLNMVIGAFFSEVGLELLKSFSTFYPESFQINEKLVINKDWTERDFSQIRKYLKKHNYDIHLNKGNLMVLKGFLIEKRSFLLSLLENPNLLEHESFTNLLWAVFHLMEELGHRPEFKNLPETDYQHLAGDLKRAYYLLIQEWLSYMHHLKRDYPYLFSLAMRTNPFDKRASVIVK